MAVSSDWRLWMREGGAIEEEEEHEHGIAAGKDDEETPVYQSSNK